MFYAIALTVGLLATFFTHGVAYMESGRAICSELAINQCYQNSNGDLFGTTNGDYQNTCINCHLEDELQTTLVCDCKANSAGGEVEYKTTSIDTNSNINNGDGVLSCYGYRGTKCRT